MSRIATNYPTPRFNSADSISSTSVLTRSSSNASSNHSFGNAGAKSSGRNDSAGVNMRSATQPSSQKETVHVCPICNAEYKDPRVLPCTHTFCLNCIRDHLIENNQLTCPKCHHQVHPFDESELNDLPPNRILSQVWRMTLQPPVSTLEPKKSFTKPPTGSTTSSKMPSQQDKRKSSVTDKTGPQTLTQEAKPHGISAIVNALSRTAGSSTKNSSRSSRSSSISSAQPMVSNLVKIYSDIAVPKPQQKLRGDSISSSGKHDELVKIFEQATKPSQHHKTPPPSIIKQSSEAEDAYEVVTCDTLVHGMIPAPPPFPDDWQSATETRHQPLVPPERPLSVTFSDRQLNADLLHDMMGPDNERSHDLSSPYLRQGLTIVPPLDSRPSTARSETDHDDYEALQLPAQSSIYATIQPRDRIRQDNHNDSVRSSISSSAREYSPARPTIHEHPKQPDIKTGSQQNQLRLQMEKPTGHILAVALSPRRSPERYGGHGVGTIFFGGESAIKQRTPSATSLRSSVSDDMSERKPTKQANLSTNGQFKASHNIPHPTQTNNLLNTHPEKPRTSAEVSNSINSAAPRSPTQNSHYLVPTPSATSTTTAIASRIDFLLSDQKRLEREIEEQMKRLQYDYDTIRKQIERRDSATQNTAKTKISYPDQNLTEQYRRKQKIYTDLATDTDTIGAELQQLKSLKNTNNNKQDIWNRLERVELNIRNIRRVLEQQKELGSELMLAEGHHAVPVDAGAQTVYKPTKPQQHFNNSPSSPRPPMASPSETVRPPSSIMPYKYMKIDHLSTLEPEAIAITENNKTILLGICNRLFILNEQGNTVTTISLSPSIRGIAISKKSQPQNIAYISHDETVSIVDISHGKTLDCVKETDSTGESGTFLPLGIDTDNVRGDVYVCDYRNSCVIKFDDKLEFITQWRVYNHSDQYDEARPKLISVFGDKLYIIVEHSCKSFYSQGIAYTFSLHICDTHSGSIIKILDADALGTQRLRWPCSIKAMNNGKCYVLDTMTSGKYFNGQWQKHWSRVLEIAQDGNNIVTELFELDTDANAMAMTQQNMLISANGDVLFIDTGFLFKNQQQQKNAYDHDYQNLP